MNGTQKREAAAAKIPCFELASAGGGNVGQLTNARKMIRAAIAVVELTHGGDTAAKDAGAELVGSRIGGNLRSGTWTPEALEGLDDATLEALGQQVGQVAADYVAGVESGQ